MSSKDADKFIESGWIASGACEVVPASLWLILVETSLIGEQLILQRCGGFNRGQGCAELIGDAERESELAINRVLHSAS